MAAVETGDKIIVVQVSHSSVVSLFLLLNLWYVLV